MWSLKQYATKQWITEKNQRNKITETNQNINIAIQKSMGYSKSSYKTDVYSDRDLPQETKISNHLALNTK